MIFGSHEARFSCLLYPNGTAEGNPGPATFATRCRRRGRTDVPSDHARGRLSVSVGQAQISCLLSRLVPAAAMRIGTRCGDYFSAELRPNRAGLTGLVAVALSSVKREIGTGSCRVKVCKYE